MAQIPAYGPGLHQIFNGLGLDFASTPPHEAIIHNNVAKDGDDCFVIIINGDQNYATGPCPYQPRGETLPQKGNRALVIVSDDNDPWIVAWWPYG